MRSVCLSLAVLNVGRRTKRKSRPGKFEACGGYARVAEWLYAASNGGYGSVDELGWYDYYAGKIKGLGPFFALIVEDSCGFITVDWFDDKEQLMAKVNENEQLYENFALEKENEHRD